MASGVKGDEGEVLSEPEVFEVAAEEVDGEEGRVHENEGGQVFDVLGVESVVEGHAVGEVDPG